MSSSKISWIEYITVFKQMTGAGKGLDSLNRKWLFKFLELTWGQFDIRHG